MISARGLAQNRDAMLKSKGMVCGRLSIPTDSSEAKLALRDLSTAGTLSVVSGDVASVTTAVTTAANVEDDDATSVKSMNALEREQRAAKKHALMMVEEEKAKVIIKKQDYQRGLAPREDKDLILWVTASESRQLTVLMCCEHLQKAGTYFSFPY